MNLYKLAQQLTFLSPSKLATASPLYRNGPHTHLCRSPGPVRRHCFYPHAHPFHRGRRVQVLNHVPTAQLVSLSRVQSEGSSPCVPQNTSITRSKSLESNTWPWLVSKTIQSCILFGKTVLSNINLYFVLRNCMHHNQVRFRLY